MTTSKLNTELLKCLGLSEASAKTVMDSFDEYESKLRTARIIGMNEAADIAAQQASDDARAADSTTDLDSRLNYMAQQERALAIEKAIRTAAMPNVQAEPSAPEKNL